ncbi:MAG: signal peptidase II [Bacilli bacterium]|nr:signal peptidase II [Bacilli bacterium]
MEEEIKVETPVETEKKPLFEKKEAKFEWNLKNIFFSFLWLAPLLIIIDQVTKWAVVNAFNKQAGPESSFVVIPNFFTIKLQYNTGSSFSLGANIPWMRFVFIAISWIASAGIVFYWIKYLKKKDALIDVVFALCLAGALGNAIDRTFYWEPVVGFSGVVDFLSFRLFGFYDFAVFNVADACLVVGVLMFVIIVIVRDILEAKRKNANNG